MLNWIAWNRTVFVFEPVYLCSTELFEMELFWHLTVWKQKTILILNWIVWNRTVYMYKNELMCHKTKRNQSNVLKAIQCIILLRNQLK